MRQTFASYSPSKFSIDITNLKYDGDNFQAESFPAFVHEYCHYIQDISHISSIFGFSLWLRDIVYLTSTFSEGEKKTIEIPLNEDTHGELFGKFRKFYLIYCGTGQLERNIRYEELFIEDIQTEIIEIPLDKGVRTIAKNILTFKNNVTDEYHFGLISLQEIQAYYAQKICEKHLGDKKYNVPTSELISLPYKLGDLIFSHFNINASDETKFLISDLCLNTIQAPKVFLAVVEELRNRTLEWERDKKNIYKIIREQELKYSFPKQEALNNIIPDITTWSEDVTRVHLSKALKWYLKIIKMGSYIKENLSPTFFSYPFVMSIDNFLMLNGFFPPPIVVNNKQFYRYYDKQNPDQDKVYEEYFQSAATIWMHWVLYDLLTSKNSDEINKKCKCPLFENCDYKEAVGNEYNCQTAPWMNIKENIKTICPYGMATHSFGLWQNDLDIRIE